MKKQNTVLKTTSMLIAALMLIATLVVLGTVSVSAAPSTTTIDGETYYLIGTADDLAWFANEVNTNKKYSINGKLTANIDLSSVCSETLGSWTPIRGYEGTFDGAGFEITELYCVGEQSGLFRGFNDEAAIVKNLTVRGYVSGTKYAGGIVAHTNFGRIENCINYATVEANGSGAYAAGIVSGGEPYIVNCKNYGTIGNTASGTNVDVGGIIGYYSDGAMLSECSNYADITLTTSGAVGGIAGTAYGPIVNCYNEGDITYTGTSYNQNVGGIAGCSIYDKSSIEGCFNNATVASTQRGEDNTRIGAIAGQLQTSAVNCVYNADKYAKAFTSQRGTVTNVNGVSASEMSDGSAAYTLGEAWGQEIGVDATPVLGGMKVYYTIDPASLCSNPTYYYANSENTKMTHDESIPAEDYENGFCTVCGDYQPATDSDGDGYLEIGNAGQLYWFAAQVNGGNTSLNAELVANITVNSNVLTASGDLNGNPEDFRAWTPIGDTNATMYRGTFQGNGYVISGLYAKDYGVGFIKKGTYANVYNLGVLDSYFENTGYASGAILGSMNSNGTIENCFSNATIAGSSYISGGLVGRSAHYTIVKNCYYFGKTVGDPFVNSGGSWYDGKCSNNYYVSSVDDGLDFTTAITIEDVTSGKLAYMLGGAFGQNLDNGETAQSHPVISDAKVYYGYTTCDEAQTAPIYTNNSAASATKPAHHDFVYAASGNEITKHCGECNKLMGTATITATHSRYTYLPVSAVVNGTGDFVGDSFVITYTDAEGNSTIAAPTEIGSYTASFTVEGETASADFTISKGTMSVAVAPTATHEYGDTYVGKAISGKVVISGNEAVEVTGTWAWVDSTTTATFTPDAEFIDLFETLATQDVTITVTEAIPVITITSPSPSIMPGMSIMFGREVKNPHSDTPASLPVSYRYVYKIGESGSLQYQTGEKLTIPSDVTVGETIYVYVENLAETGKYAVGQSNTVELLVGQVDYSEDIQNVIDDLDAAKANLDQAIIDLNAADKKNADDLAQAIIDLNAAIDAAEAAADAAAKADDAALKAALESKIDTADAALDAAIDAVQATLDQAIIDLNAADKKNADDLAQAIVDLNAAIDAAEAAADAAAKADDAALKAALESKIDTADAALGVAIDAVQKKLDDAKAALEKSVADNKAALDAKDGELQTFIIVVCVMSGVAICGSGAFVTWFFIDRKKRI